MNFFTILRDVARIALIPLAIIFHDHAFFSDGNVVALMVIGWILAPLTALTCLLLAITGNSADGGFVLVIAVAVIFDLIGLVSNE